VIVEHLIVDTFGSHIGKYSKRLKVTQRGETLAEAPLLHLEAVLVTGRGVSISADALEACAEHGIPVHFIDSLGHTYAAVYSAGLTGTVLTRRAQLAAYVTERGASFARSIVTAKLHNQSATLKYLAKNRKETDPDLYRELRLCAGDVLDFTARLDGLVGESLADIRLQLMGIEGNAARHYWQAVGYVLPETYRWPGRSGRGAVDPINSLLNYGYGILYSQIERVLVLAGLDPYGGFLHADRPGKPSLVLDLIEEFRQVAIDRVVIGLATREFTVEQDQADRLTEETRRSFAGHVLKHLDANMRYSGKRYPLRIIMQMQARHLASFLRGDCGQYIPFMGSW